MSGVAVVPDFTGENPLLFEARTLFFLAAWLERGGRTPVRLCCIGEPPASVRHLAACAGAAITVHEPVRGFWGGFANKLRGLEGIPAGERRLVLDVDVLVLGDLPDAQSDFAAAVAGKPQVPQHQWEQIYALLELPLPRERIASVRGQLGLSLQTVAMQYENQAAESTAMLPYFNSGVLAVREGTGLRERWEDHMRRILRFATGKPEYEALHAVMFGDQVGLATALHSLRLEGRTFGVLPDACNARLVHLSAGALRWADLRLFHATGFLREMGSRAELPAALETYAQRWGAALGTPEPGEYLQRLWERWVRPHWTLEQSRF